MPTDIVLCDRTDGVARLQYFLLRQAPELSVEIATDAFRGVELAARVRPAAVVTELALEGIAEAELVKRYRASSPSSNIVAWTELDDPAKVASALAAGASGYVLKREGEAELLGAVRAVAGGVVAISPQIAQLVGAQLGALSSRVGELEHGVAEAARQMRDGTSAKADFLANISHELRTPVTVAKGISFVLKNPLVGDQERDEFIEQLTTSLDKLMTMIDEMITIAELERGTLELDPAPIDLAPLLRHACEEIGRQYPSIRIQQDVPDMLPAYVDAARIGDVARQLLDNACRYSPSDQPVEVHARALAEGTVVTVTDRGGGMRREVTAAAFDQPFSTGEATLRKEKAGVGIGLHLARQVVVGQGGIMWADPIPSGGTRVSFCVPTHDGAEGPLGTQLTAAPTPT
jgi:signal transduction histidine kinase